jgi:hypothetical protein
MLVENQFLTFMSVFKSLLSKLANPSSLPYSPGTRTSSTPVSPTYASTNTSASTLENLSRTIRGYVHSSIPIPTSPSSISRAVSIATSSGSRASHQEFERDYELDNEEDYEYYGNSKRHHEPNSGNVDVPSSGRLVKVAMGSSGLAQAMQRNIDVDPKPPSDQVETIIWARWDVLHERYASRFYSPASLISRILQATADCWLLLRIASLGLHRSLFC